MLKRHEDLQAWRMAFAPAALIMSGVLGLFYYWFVVADRYVVFLYNHNGADPFEPATISRYWMTGLVASGLVMVLYVLLNACASRLWRENCQSRWPHRFFSRAWPGPAGSNGEATGARQRVYQPPSGWRIWLLCAPILALGIPMIVRYLGQPALSPAQAAMCVAATLIGLALALVLGSFAAYRSAEALWLLLYGAGLTPALLVLRVIELSGSDSANALWFGALATVSVILGGAWLGLVTGAQVWLRQPTISAVRIWVAGLGVSYLLLPLLHYLFLVPPAWRYVSVSANFFANTPGVQLTCLGAAAALAGTVPFWRRGMSRWLASPATLWLEAAGRAAGAKVTELSLGFVFLLLGVLAILCSSNGTLANSSQPWYAMDLYPDHAHPGTYYVVSDCGDSGSANQLRDKLSAAQSRGGGTITFTCGPSIVLNAAYGALPTITTNITINGGNTITLSGNNASRLFFVDGGTLTLNNITITKGYYNGDGGAIYNNIGTLNINNSKFLYNETTLNGNGGAIISFGALNVANSEFAYNKAANGGALYSTGGAAVTTVTGSNFHDNQTKDTITYGWGGAVYMSAGAAVTIQSSTLSANKARYGGAVYVYQTSSLTHLTVNNNSTLSSNSGDDGGGGIYILGGTATLTNVTLSGNSGGLGYGGGIHNYLGTATLTNVTLSGNSAGAGGGIYILVGIATLTNVTLSGNWAGVGGGIYQEESSGTTTLTNVTMSGNLADDGSGIWNTGTASLKNTLIAKGAGNNCYGPIIVSFNLSDDTSCGFGAGRDNVNLLLGPLTNNGGPTLTHMPQPGSPAIDGGTGSGCPSTDQRGASRVGPGTGNACDVGSVEYGAILPWLYLPLIVR